MKTKLTSAVTCLAWLAAAAPAGAAIVPGVAIDGPSADVGPTLPLIDVAPDGSAALVYIKKLAAVDHVFVSQLVNGAWSAPLQVDAGSMQAAAQARIAVANGGKVVVAYRRAAVDFVAQVRPSAGAPFGSPEVIGNATITYVNLDLAPGGNGYAVLGNGNDVFAKQLVGTTFSDVGAGAALDNAAGEEAGALGNNTVQVAASTDGASAVMVWSEVLPGGTGTDTFARRLSGTTPGSASGLKLDALAGAEPYTPMKTPVADQAEVDIDGTGTAWVVFRQNFLYGGLNKPRAIARALPPGGSVGPGQLVDGMPEPPTEGRDYQRIDLNDAGQGLITHYGNLTNPFEVATLSAGTWTKGTLVNTTPNSGVPLGSPAIGESGSGLVAWTQDPGGGGDKTALARTTLGGLGAPITLSSPAFGSVASGVEAGAGAGFAAATFLQLEGAANRRIVAAVVDLPQPATPQPMPPVDTTKPELTRLKLARKRFRLGRALPTVAGAAAVKTGTTISFRLSEAAAVKLSFKRALPGRRVGKRCRRPSRRNRGRRRCTRLVSVRGASLTRSVEGGVRKIRFSGRISRRKSLKPGAYQLTLLATDQAGNVSSPDRARFTLLKRKQRKG